VRVYDPGVLLLAVALLSAIVFLLTISSDQRTENAVRLLEARWPLRRSCSHAGERAPLGPAHALVPTQRGVPDRTDDPGGFGGPPPSGLRGTGGEARRPSSAGPP
jgi:hypothetical protein